MYRSRIVGILLCALFGIGTAHASFIYTWDGVVTSATTLGLDIDGNPTAFPSPTGGPISVRLELSDSYVPGSFFDASEIVSADMELPGGSWGAPPFGNSFGDMPQTIGDGFLSINAGVGILNVGSTFYVKWEETCLNDLIGLVSQCFGVQVLGTGGPWRMISPFEASEPRTAFALMALLLYGHLLYKPRKMRAAALRQRSGLA